MEPKLYLVPTPIGNLQDITLRALETLKSVDLILAEDTRTTGKLLKHFDIQTTQQSYHIHNEHQTVGKIIERLEGGIQIALVSDAGTPGISDPGYLLIRECLRKDIAIECLPGPVALIPALIKSGFPTDRFLFEGFLPHKKGRKTRILELLSEKRTTVLYESPHRLVKLLEQIIEHLGAERMISVSRELTKIYEETVTDRADVVLEHYKSKPVKGEIVVVISGTDYSSK